jgi:hypothetical protein
LVLLQMLAGYQSIGVFISALHWNG